MVVVNTPVLTLLAAIAVAVGMAINSHQMASHAKISTTVMSTTMAVTINVTTHWEMITVAVTWDTNSLVTEKAAQVNLPMASYIHYYYI